jgi:hypothetical protein
VGPFFFEGSVNGPSSYHQLLEEEVSPALQQTYENWRKFFIFQQDISSTLRSPGPGPSGQDI